jgi:hypothetical protein
MDPLSAMLLALWVAGYFTRNTVQDLVWKARGEDPPSVRREQARRERRAERAADPGPGRRFWGHVWADAVASAEEHRERVAARKAQKRRARWSEQDAAAAEDEAYEINERFVPAEEPTATIEPAKRDEGVCDTCNRACKQSVLVTRRVDGYGRLWVCPSCAEDLKAGRTVPLIAERDQADPVVHDEVVWYCRGCGTRMCNAGMDSYERGEELCRACRAIEDNAAAPRRCRFCHRTFPTVELWPTRTTDGQTVGACPDCWHDQNTHRPAPATVDDAEQPEPPTTADPEPGDAEIIQFADWQRPATGSTEKENNMSAEITGLQSAIAYATGSAAAAERAAGQDEMAIANLQAGGTTGAAIASLQASMEGHTQNAAHYRAAAATLTQQLQVKEAYEANQGAGEKKFVTSE